MRLCVYARLESEKAGGVKCMRTGKTEWARELKKSELSEFPRHLVEFIA
jgi:hypothetical protein